MQSFGLNVAAIAGLHPQIIETAKVKSEELHSKLVEVYRRYLASR